jgi:hypothetical protein
MQGLEIVAEAEASAPRRKWRLRFVARRIQGESVLPHLPQFVREATWAWCFLRVRRWAKWHSAV